MKSRKARLAAAVTAGALTLTVAAPAIAAPPVDATRQSGGAAGLVAAVVQIDDTLNELSVLSNIGTIEVVEVENNNVLNNSPILSNNNIEVLIQNVLNNNNVLSQNDVDDLIDVILENNVVAIDILSGGTVVVYVDNQ